MMHNATGTDRRAPAFASDTERWEAVVHHDPRADGTFWYAVRTTGVYCRPSCPARPALQKNVSFHASCAAAEQAGFRACKRCRPNEVAPAERRAAVVAAACRAIDEAEEAPGLGELAQAAGMSRFYFHRVFKATTGITPKAYADAQRARRVRDGLPHSDTVTEAIYSSGFNSNGRFYERAGGLLGMTPTAFRAGGHGAAIRFAVGQCWLGAILVAATERGVCSILLGDDPEALLRDFQDRFPAAHLIGGDRSFETLIATVVGFVAMPVKGLDLPLDIHGTAFQQRVWQALRDIPAGTTASYRDVARRIGRPAAARAVAQACAANRLAVAIPCHRVVSTDGSLSGYRWGIDRKRALLAREAS